MILAKYKAQADLLLSLLPHIARENNFALKGGTAINLFIRKIPASPFLSLAQKAFGIRINPQDAFKAFTIERLAEMLEAALLSKIEEMSEDEVKRRLSNRN